MYCQTCGTEIKSELNYCNRCGAVVNASLSSPATGQQPVLVDLKSPVRTLGATITLTTLLGLMILFISLAELASAERRLPTELLGVLSVSGLLLILIIDVMLIRILSRLVQLPAAAPALQAQSRRPESRELHPPAAQTYMPTSTAVPLPVQSVTDHTTRTFHPNYQEPRAND